MSGVRKPADRTGQGSMPEGVRCSRLVGRNNHQGTPRSHIVIHIIRLYLGEGTAWLQRVGPVTEVCAGVIALGTD